MIRWLRDLLGLNNVVAFENVPKQLPRDVLNRLDRLMTLIRDHLDNDGDEPEDWPDPAKLRTIALYLYAWDWSEGRYDEDAMQMDLMRIADYIEEDHGSL